MENGDDIVIDWHATLETDDPELSFYDDFMGTAKAE